MRRRPMPTDALASRKISTCARRIETHQTSPMADSLESTVDGQIARSPASASPDPSCHRLASPSAAAHPKSQRLTIFSSWLRPASWLESAFSTAVRHGHLWTPSYSGSPVSVQKKLQGLKTALQRFCSPLSLCRYCLTAAIRRSFAIRSSSCGRDSRTRGSRSRTSSPFSSCRIGQVTRSRICSAAQRSP